METQGNADRDILVTWKGITSRCKLPISSLSEATNIAKKKFGLDQEKVFLKYLDKQSNVLVTLLDDDDLSYFASSGMNLLEMTETTYSLESQITFQDFPTLDPTLLVVESPPVSSGNFGKVYKGLYDKALVAVKQMHEDEDPSILKQEIKLIRCDINLPNAFSTLRAHPNIVHYLGQCTTKELGTVLVMEWMEAGSLLSFLRGVNRMDVNLVHLSQFCLQIGRGLKHLHSNQIIHRDLAARNCLLRSRDLKSIELKITDFGLSKNSIYYQSNGLIPVNWTAIEGLETRKFYPASDIWSFGVVIWEIFSFGEHPYGDVPNTKVFLKEGKRLTNPVGCPGVVYDKMLQCWDKDHTKRIGIDALISFFNESDAISASIVKANYDIIYEDDSKIDANIKNKKTFSSAKVVAETMNSFSLCMEIVKKKATASEIESKMRFLTTNLKQLSLVPLDWEGTMIFDSWLIKIDDLPTKDQVPSHELRQLSQDLEKYFVKLQKMLSSD